jgi:hypothetical protein
MKTDKKLVDTHVLPGLPSGGFIFLIGCASDSKAAIPTMGSGFSASQPPSAALKPDQRAGRINR